MNSTSRLVITSVSALAITVGAALPAFAETGNYSAASAVNSGTVMRVTPTTAVVGANASAHATASVSIDDRIAMFENALARMNSLSTISTASRTHVTAIIQAQIDKLKALKASGATTVGGPGTGNAGTGSAVSSAPSAGVYLSVMSKVAITTAADHVLVVTGQLDNFAAKLDARISAATNVDATALRATLADMKAKVADAKTNANAALADVSGLSDDADASASTSVAASFKDAAAKIGAARTDLGAAYKDAAIIVKAVHGLNIGSPTSASANVSGNANAQ